MYVLFWVGRPRLRSPSAAPSKVSEDRSGFATSIAYLGSAGAPGGPRLGVPSLRSRSRSSSDRGVGGLGHKGLLGARRSG